MQTSAIQLTDVTLRDGLQMEAKVISVEEKIDLFKSLQSCRYSRIEMTSFVHPKWVPQFSDAEVFCKKLFEINPKIETMAFVPNEKGLKRFLAFPIPWVSTFVAASESFNQKNVNETILETLVELKKTVDQAHQEKRKVRVYVSTVFGCPYQGKIDKGSLFETLKKVVDLSPDEVALSDTIGVAVPNQVRDILAQFNSFYPKEKTALHMHDTYGLALSNVQAAYEAGIRNFDGSTGGIGGCPYAKGASGNLASEEIAYSFFRQGIMREFPVVPLTKVFAQLKKLGLHLHSHLSEISEKGGTPYV